MQFDFGYEMRQPALLSENEGWSIYPASLKGTLAEAGASFADVVKVNTYIVDLDDEKVAAVGLAVHNAFKHLPREQRAASTWVGVTSLVEESLGVEIECTAVVPEARGKL